MQINFGSGYNNFQVGKQEVQRVKEEITSQSIQVTNKPEVTEQERGTRTCSSTYTEVVDDKTRTVTLKHTLSYPGNFGIGPTNDVSTAELLKLHSMNYNIR